MSGSNALALATMFGVRSRDGPGMVASPGAWVWCVWQVVKSKLIGSGNAITFKVLGSNMNVRLETFNTFSILLIYFFTF